LFIRKIYVLAPVSQGMMNAKGQPRAKPWYGNTKGKYLDN
jgi:hypothetical protein